MKCTIPYIYAPTANGTFDASLPPTNTDYGDSLLKLAISTSPSSFGQLSVADYFTPSNVFSYSGKMGLGLCINDEDFGSGGVTILPDSFYSGHPDLTVSADKQSNMYLVDRDSLGKFNNGAPTQLLNYPTTTGNNVPGYWSSPAYWKYTLGGSSSYQIYYAPDETNTGIPPYALSMYSLTPSGLPTSGPTASTPTLFCAQPHAPTPSISSNGSTQNTGVIWAIESSNTDNPTHGDCNLKNAGPAVLHAYNATPQQPTPTTLTELYPNGKTLQTKVGYVVNFPTPTIFNGRVYFGTRSIQGGNKGEIDVFGTCPVPPGGCLP